MRFPTLLHTEGAMRLTCRANDCWREPNRKGFLCGVHDKELDRAISRILDAVAEVSADVYVGRSAYPERRLLEHVRDSGSRPRCNLAVLNWTCDWGETEALEKRVIRAANARFTMKGKNRSKDSDGKWRSDWNCVYIAWIPKANGGSLTRWPVVTVTDLDPSRRLVPRRGLYPFQPIRLVTSVEPEQASDELGRLVEYRGRTKPQARRKSSRRQR